VVDDSTLTAGIVVGATVAPPGVLLRIVAQPFPQCPVRVYERFTVQGASICGSAQPDQSTCHPFAHLHHVDQVSDGGASPARA